MAKTVVGLFRDMTTAERVVRELQNGGFRRDDISLVAPDAEGRYGRDLGTTGHTEGHDAGSGAAAGAGTGAVLGGLAGLLIGLGALAIPGIGPIVAAGPLMSALAGAGIGAAAGGLIGALTSAGVPEEDAHYYAEGVKSGNTLVMVRTTDDMAQRASDVMNRFDPIDVDKRSGGYNQTSDRSFTETGTDRNMTDRGMKDRGMTDGGMTDRNTTERRTTEYSGRDMNQLDDKGEARLPIVEEEMSVGKREVQKGGVRVHSYVEETPVEKTVDLREEHVNVERRDVNRPATKGDLDAFQEGTIEVNETNEVPMVDKQARVTGEVVVRKDVENRQETVRDTVRKTKVDTENLGKETRTSTTGFDTYEPGFRQHFNTNYSNRGYNYDNYQPAYRYGYDLRQNKSYSGRQWNDVERDARRDWERQYPDNKWDDFKDAVRQGWESMKGNR